MTKQEIINECYNKIEELNKKTVVTTSEMDFYEKFTRENSPFSYEMFSEISGTDFLIAVLNCCYEDIPFDKIYNDINKIRRLLDGEDVEDIEMLIGALRYISDNELDDQMINSLKDNNRHRVLKSIRDMISMHAGIDSMFQDILRDSECEKSIVLPLLEYNKINHAVIYNLLHFIIESKDMKYCIDRITKDIHKMARQAGVVLTSRELSKSIDKSINKTIKMNCHTNEIKECFLSISEYYKKLTDEVKNTENNKNRSIRAYENLINGLNRAFNSDEITNYEALVKKVPDEEIRKAVLKLVYQHNKINYEELDSTYKELSKNSTVHFLALLKQYDISKDEVNLNKIMRNDYDTLYDMLKLISYITTDKLTIINAIQVSNVVTCKYLKELKDKGVINTTTFTKYPSIFDSNSDEFNKLDNNIKTLSTYKINPAIFVNNPNVMLETNIKDSLEVLEEYNLMKSMKNSGDYNYLAKDNLCGLIDKIIELGFEDYLVNDMSLLNENNWDRIYVLKALGYKIESKEELLSYLRSNTFIVPDDKLSYYIPNAVSYYECKEDNLYSSLLNEYNSSERTFNIDGIIVSKRRFYRNYRENSNSLIKCIIDGGIYSRDEIGHIEKVLNGSKEK